MPQKALCDLGITLYVIRHGETDWNREGRLQGQHDVPLNAQGHKDAEKSGEKLYALLSERTDLPPVISANNDDNAHMMFISPLLRTRQTTHIIRQNLWNIPTHIINDADLQELTFGDWEGLTWREIVQRNPREAQARQQDKWGYVPPNGENYAMLLIRVKEAMARLVHMLEQRRASCATIVAHGGVSRVLLAWLCGMQHQKAALTHIPQDRILIIKNGAYHWH